MGCVCIPLQLVTGDLAARRVAAQQPAKLAACEALYRTQRGAPLVIGGLANDEEARADYAVEIPGGLSLLLNNRVDSEVPGLDRIPRDQWPNVRWVHLSFDLMVGCGMTMLGVAAWAAVAGARRKPLTGNRWLLRAFLLASPMGFIAIEAGWMVTELGRQPWIIYGVMRTADTVTPMPGLVAPFALFTLVYVAIPGTAGGRPNPASP